MASKKYKSTPFLIGVTGGSGSGKTSFIKRLREDFTEEELCIISQDDYYFPREAQLVDEQGIHNFDRPASIDKKAFVADVQRLLKGEKVTRLEYTFNNENAHPKELIFQTAPIIVVEGIFIMKYKKIRKLLDVKVFVHAKENLKVIRRIRRDQVERNYPLDDVLYRYEHHVLPTFEKYILPYMDQADVVVNNNRSFDKGYEVFKGFLRDKLRRMKQSGEADSDN